MIREPGSFTQNDWLVVWTPLKNISQLGWLFPIYGKIKNVPNHQPDDIKRESVADPSDGENFHLCVHRKFRVSWLKRQKFRNRQKFQVDTIPNGYTFQLITHCKTSVFSIFQQHLEKTQHRYTTIPTECPPNLWDPQEMRLARWPEDIRASGKITMNPCKLLYCKFCSFINHSNVSCMYMYNMYIYIYSIIPWGDAWEHHVPDLIVLFNGVVSQFWTPCVDWDTVFDNSGIEHLSPKPFWIDHRVHPVFGTKIEDPFYCITLWYSNMVCMEYLPLVDDVSVYGPCLLRLVAQPASWDRFSNRTARMVELSSIPMPFIRQGLGWMSLLGDFGDDLEPYLLEMSHIPNSWDWDIYQPLQIDQWCSTHGGFHQGISPVIIHF